MDLTNIYRIFHLMAAENTFFSAAHGIFSKIYHILGHKASLKITIKEIISCAYNEIKLETDSKINNRNCKHTEFEKNTFE
jgi:hypothetical protein